LDRAQRAMHQVGTIAQQARKMCPLFGKAQSALLIVTQIRHLRSHVDEGTFQLRQAALPLLLFSLVAVYSLLLSSPEGEGRVSGCCWVRNGLPAFQPVNAACEWAQEFSRFEPRVQRGESAHLMSIFYPCK